MLLAAEVSKGYLRLRKAPLIFLGASFACRHGTY
jgi:hypothetical protein